MVLFKRKTVTVEPPKYTPEHADQPVWFIPETLEYFCTYDAYLERIDFYHKKKFICELSGASCLTFFDARLRELKETENVLERFPEPLKRPILARVHMSTITRLDQLVDELYGWLKDEFFVGETVMVRFHDQRVRAEVTKATDGIYQVDDGRRILEGDASQLARDRKIVSKLTLRAFVKHSASREQWVGAPWIVREDYAKLYELPRDIPPEIQRLYNMRAEEVAQAKSGVWVPPSERADATSPGGSKTIGFDDLSGFGISELADISKQGGKSRLPLARKRLLKILMPFTEPSHYKNDDLFRIARYAADDELSEFVNIHSWTNSWPKWHQDPRLCELEESGKISHLIEVWLFSHYFRDLLELKPENLQTFDQFVEDLAASEVSAAIAHYHEAVMGLFVPAGSSELALSLPKQADLDAHKQKRRAGRPAKRAKIRNDSEDEDVDADGQEHEEEHDPNDTANGEGDLQDGEDQEDHENHEDRAHDKNESESEGDAESEAGSKSDGEQENDKATWVQRIGRRNFEGGEWQQLLGEILTDLKYLRDWKSETNSIAQLLVPHNQPRNPSYAAVAYSKLTFSQRVHALIMLVRILYSSPQLRDYLDTQYDKLMKLKKRPLARELRQLGEDLRSVERVIAIAQEQALVADEKPQARTEEQDTETGNSKTSSETSPVKKLGKTDEETPDIESLMITRDNLLQQTEIKAAEAEDVNRQIACLDNQRMKLLGKDRFFNRYWWIDGNGLSSSFGESFAMGRLCVQGPSPEDLEQCINSRDYSDSFIAYRKLIKAEASRLKNNGKLQNQRRRDTKSEIEKLSGSLAPSISTNSSGSTLVQDQISSKAPEKSQNIAIPEIKRIIEELTEINRVMQGLTYEETSELRSLQSKLSRLSDGAYPAELENNQLSLMPPAFKSTVAGLDEEGEKSQLEHCSSLSHAGENSQQRGTTKPHDVDSSVKLEPQSTHLLEQHKSLKQAQEQAQLQAQLSARVQAHFDAEVQAQSKLRAALQQSEAQQPHSMPDSGLASQVAIQQPSQVASVPPLGAPQPPYSMVAPQSQPVPGIPPGTYPPPQAGYPGQTYTPPQGQVQWVIQQTTYGPMLYAMPSQQYQMLVQQYQQPAVPHSLNADVYQAYLQQVAMQQSYVAQQYPYVPGYPPSNVYGAMPPPPHPPHPGAPMPPQAMMPPMASTSGHTPSIVPAIAPRQPAPQPNREPMSQATMESAAQSPSVRLAPLIAPDSAAAPFSDQAPTEKDHSTHSPGITGPSKLSSHIPIPKPESSANPSESQARSAENFAEQDSSQGVVQDLTNDGSESGSQKSAYLAQVMNAPDFTSEFTENSSSHKDETESLPDTAPVTDEDTPRVECEKVNAEEAKGSPDHNVEVTRNEHKSVEAKVKSIIEINGDDTGRKPVKHGTGVHGEQVLTPQDLLGLFQRGEALTSPNQWRFYETPQEVEKLITYLFDLGGRETQLIEALRKAESSIKDCMNRRLKSLNLNSENKDSNPGPSKTEPNSS